MARGDIYLFPGAIVVPPGAFAMRQHIGMLVEEIETVVEVGGETIVKVGYRAENEDEVHGRDAVAFLRAYGVPASDRDAAHYRRKIALRREIRAEHEAAPTEAARAAIRQGAPARHAAMEAQR